MAQTFWRLTKAKYAYGANARGPFSGYGSMLHAGRWHPKGYPVVYAAQSAALALLETLVHVERAVLLQFEYAVLPVKVGDQDIETLPETAWPEGWNAWPYRPATQQLGARWFDEARSVALVVPSAVVPHERNVLFNPTHPAFASLEIGDPEAFPIDERLIG